MGKTGGVRIVLFSKMQPTSRVSTILSWTVPIDKSNQLWLNQILGYFKDVGEWFSSNLPFSDSEHSGTKQQSSQLCLGRGLGWGTTILSLTVPLDKSLQVWFNQIFGYFKMWVNSFLLTFLFSDSEYCKRSAEMVCPACSHKRICSLLSR